MSTSELGESFISVLWQNITLLVFPPYTMLTMSEKKKKFTVYSFFMNNAWGKYDSFSFCIFPINNNISSMRYFQGNLRLTWVKYLSEKKNCMKNSICTSTHMVSLQISYKIISQYQKYESLSNPILPYRCTG